MVVMVVVVVVVIVMVVSIQRSRRRGEGQRCSGPALSLASWPAGFDELG